MLLRKKNQLRIAYALLAITAASVIAYDSEQRTDTGTPAEQSPSVPARRAAAALPMAPLAQSPFREASLEGFLASQAAMTRTQSKAKAPGGHRLLSSSVYFLKVAVQVPSKDGPLTLNRGTRVRLVREQDGKMRVRRDTIDFLIEKSQVTDDLNELATLARISS